MGEVLSQSEIDSLLNALSNGELDVDEVKDTGEKKPQMSRNLSSRVSTGPPERFSTVSFIAS